MNRLFIYGTLKEAKIQRKIIGRIVKMKPDRIRGFRESTIIIEEEVFPCLVKGSERGIIEGFTLEISEEELKKIDEYETDSYKRIITKTNGGVEAYVYIKNENNIA